MTRPASRFRCAFLLPLALCAAIAAPPAAAQLADFSAIATTNPTLKIEQSVQVVADGALIHAFSGLSRRFATLRGAYGPPAWDLSNEHLIVQDGPVFYGFSSRTGTFAGLWPMSPSADLVPNSSPQSWFSVVTEGDKLHFFSALDGQWHTSIYPAAPSVDTNGRLCVVVEDGATVWGISAYYGDPVALPVSGATTYGAYGNLAVATSSGEVHCFSAHRNTWASLPVAGAPAISYGFSGQPGFVCIQDGATIAFYSGQTGTFTVLPASPSSAVSLHRMCAAVVDGTTAYAYSGALGAYETKSFAAPPAVKLSHFFTILGDGTAWHAYSATTNSFAGPLAGSHDFVLTQVAACATPTASTTPGFAYSCLKNAWVAAPPVPDAEVYRAANSIVLVDPLGGMHAFTPRSTAWRSLAAPHPDAVYQGNSAQGPGLFTALSGNVLHTFNPRSGRWRSIGMEGVLLGAAPHWNASIFHDGTNAYAFGALNDRWSTIPLSDPSPDLEAQIYSACVAEGAKVTAYTALGQLTASADFPDYWRLASGGGRLRLDLAGEPNAPALLLVGYRTGAGSPGPGLLGIEPSALVLFAAPYLNDSGLAGMTLTVPGGYSGTSLRFQALIDGPAGRYLTNAQDVRIM